MSKGNTVNNGYKNMLSFNKLKLLNIEIHFIPLSLNLSCIINLLDKLNFVYNESKIVDPGTFIVRVVYCTMLVFGAFFVSDYEKKEGTTAVEVKQEVEMHLKEKDIIEATIPGNIVIGPFWVNTENVKQTLSKKRKNLSNAMLELLARKLRNQADDVRALICKIIYFYSNFISMKVYNLRRMNDRNFDVTVFFSDIFLC